MTFTDPNIRDRIRLDSVICVIDADQVFAYPEYPPLIELKLRQVGFADMVILNKVDLAGPEQVKKVNDWLDEHFNRLRIFETNYCEVPYEILLGVGLFDPSRSKINLHESDHICSESSCSDHGHPHNHSKIFSTWSFETDLPIETEVLREILRKLPGSVYRAKGVVYTTEVPLRRAVLQVVGRRVDISLQDEWKELTPRTRIVVIGSYGGLDTEMLSRQFKLALSPNHIVQKPALAGI